jgi:tetratricopeptide (TPR) repeat protein
VPVDSSPSSPPVFDPQTWVDLLTDYVLKGDMMSVTTLTVIHEGIAKLARTLEPGGAEITITNQHSVLFERLYRSFNSPVLLKEVGAIYLKEFRLPSMALRHLDLARQYAPKDRDIEQLQVEAAVAVADEASESSGHSGLETAGLPQPNFGELLRNTARLPDLAEARGHLNETAGQLTRKHEIARQAATPAQVQAALDDIEHLIARSNFVGAASALEAARNAGMMPEKLQSLYAQLGLVTFDRDRTDDALAAFIQLRDLNPEAVEGWFNCGLVYKKMGRLDEALESFQQAQKIAPDNAKTWCNLSAVWFEKRNFEEAEKTARAALELKGDYARAWDGLASVLSATDRLTEAAAAAQQAIRLQPSLHSAWFKYGVINFQLDELLLASEAFEMTAGNPHFFNYVVYYQAMIEARRGELELAVEKFEDARGADPENELRPAATKEIASAYAKAGDHATSADFFTKVTELVPGDFSAWLALGTARHRQEKLGEAQQAYLRATELDPLNPVPWHNLGLLASDQRKPEEAWMYFQREVQLAPNDAKAWYDLGVVLRTLGREVESAEAFEQAEGLVKSLARRSNDLSAALSIVRRLGLSGRVLKE